MYIIVKTKIEEKGKLLSKEVFLLAEAITFIKNSKQYT